MSQVFIRNSSKAVVTFARCALRPSTGLVHRDAFTNHKTLQYRFFSSKEGSNGEKDSEIETPLPSVDASSNSSSDSSSEGPQSADVDDADAGGDAELKSSANKSGIVETEEPIFTDFDASQYDDVSDAEINKILRESGGEGYVERQEYKSGEPEYLVTEDEYLEDPSILKLPYLNESTKQEIYEKHKLNPEKYTAKVLSQIYRASVDRIEAILFLMQHRADVLEKEEAALFELAEPEKILTIIAEYSKELENFSDEQPDEIENVHEKIIEEKRQRKKGEVAPQFDKEGVIKNLSEKHKLPLDKVKMIADSLDSFIKRTQDIQDYESYMESKIELLKDMGVENADTFQESPSVVAKKKTIEETYFPKLFGDEEAEEQKRVLLRRIAQETKGKIKASLIHYVDDEEKNKLDMPPLHVDPTAMDLAAEKKPTRFRFALRDISSSNSNKRTVICTRSGRLRWATPLEEARRSWNERPNQMDFLKNKDVVAKYADFDKDDHLVLELAKARRARRQKFVEEVKARSEAS